MNFTENEKRTIIENQLCLDNESMSMKLELLFTENKRLREALEKIEIETMTNVTALDSILNIREIVGQALGE